MSPKDLGKRRKGEFPLCSKKKRRVFTTPKCMILKCLDAPIVSSITGSTGDSICLKPNKLYTFGRKKSCCDFIFLDRRVSKRHCQLFFDGVDRKLFIVDGFVLPSDSGLDQIRGFYGSKFEKPNLGSRGNEASLNGVFVNGFRLGNGDIRGLDIGDEVSFVCGNKLDSEIGCSLGFLVKDFSFGEGTDRLGDGKTDRYFKDEFVRVISKLGNIEGKTSDKVLVDAGKKSQLTRYGKKNLSFLCNNGKRNLCQVYNSTNDSLCKCRAVSIMGNLRENQLLMKGNKSSYFSIHGVFHESDFHGELITKALGLLDKCKNLLQSYDCAFLLQKNVGTSSVSVTNWSGHDELLVEDEVAFRRRETAAISTIVHSKKLNGDENLVLEEKLGMRSCFERSSLSSDIVEKLVPNCNLEEHCNRGLASEILLPINKCNSYPTSGFENSMKFEPMYLHGGPRKMHSYGKSVRKVTGDYMFEDHLTSVVDSIDLHESPNFIDSSEKAVIRDNFQDGKSYQNSPNLSNVSMNVNLCRNKGIVADVCLSNISSPNHSRMPGYPDKGLSGKSIEGLQSEKSIDIDFLSSGKTIFLNRLEFMSLNSSDQPATVSLPDLFTPVESLSGIFIATFTNDIMWFLTCCKVPKNLPMTIACHNTERCWSPNCADRYLLPYPEYPNLIVIYPPFPDTIAFGKDRKRQGVACHHPKLFVLQREDSIRVVITSANLVSTQWNKVTNTVWWQDFPRSTLDLPSLFSRSSSWGEDKGSQSDFAAHLAGFIASLVIDVPRQAHWIIELSKYDFKKASVHLIASIPGLHERVSPYMMEHMHVLTAMPVSIHSQFVGASFLGSVQASVVGLTHRFRSNADTNGEQLRSLASILGNCRGNAYGKSEVVLKRNFNIPADPNAVSVIVSDLVHCSEETIHGEDYVQLGFLPRDVAKWVAPLCDADFFSFSAFVSPQEALAAALVGNNNKVHLLLYVFEGPKFSQMPKLMEHEHVAAMCHLLVSIQRCLGLWRLQEVLSQYKWPESQEIDFIYGASSVGTSLDAQFLGAFSTATGKRSILSDDSQESDPEWGCWNAEHEEKKSSIRILYPTIEQVRNGAHGIWPYRRLLSFSEKTWQRLRTANMFHDAIPRPCSRVGYPMHVKVARRRFWCKSNATSFGWIYCGSHNFSPAAWGRPLKNSSGSKQGPTTSSILGSRLHICNYELGVILIVPPPDICRNAKGITENLDDIMLPFVVPAPKYQGSDRPATAQAMRQALVESMELEKKKNTLLDVEQEVTDIEVLEDDEEMVDVSCIDEEKKEEDNYYAEILWNQVDSPGV
ncbi:LOW QUALITY PROTEIN: uncharacterized protein LOC18434585 [Amborella trichopoda]|uniref:LOW QUALITY PROTEIN: uncharacterized protein LOC18434585 n=1 Tax=Amborella trichopoda TaxID=13333 RepID=UPI0005D4404F|nr:LOW QUALITY PROTEIN: uncharacterized protein LOC18434585 [Amborella trichopoda]|eukprot:XP_011623559.1 LOW QUALITY PROTEIN: uncharacterized protein LOC18434585 [Amborella trichopoda]